MVVFLLRQSYIGNILLISVSFITSKNTLTEALNQYKKFSYIAMFVIIGWLNLGMPCNNWTTEDVQGTCEVRTQAFVDQAQTLTI